MLEESLPSIWASMHSWFTPTILFILINVVIGTIAFSSSQKEEKENKPHLVRTSSVLQRLRSFKLHRQEAEETPPTIATLEPQQTETVETLEAIAAVNSSSGPQDDQDHLPWTEPDVHPTSGERKEELPQQMLRRSASAKSALVGFGGEEEEEEMVGPTIRRPATMKEGKAIGDDEEVDARADDFINKFKQQLKLQRLDSILKRKETLKNSK